MKFNAVVWVLILMIVLTYPIFCGTILIHEFCHVLVAKMLGHFIADVSFSCIGDQNPEMIIDGERASIPIALGSLLRLIIVIPFLIFLFRYKDTIFYWWVYAYYSVIVLIMIMMMEHDFKMVGLEIIRILLFINLLGIGLIPLVFRKKKIKHTQKHKV